MALPAISGTPPEYGWHAPWSRAHDDLPFIGTHRNYPNHLFALGLGTNLTAAFLAEVMNRFDLGDRWCYHALHEDGRFFGFSNTQLQALYDSAELIINLHGGTEPLPEHAATGRRDGDHEHHQTQQREHQQRHASGHHPIGG